MTRRNFLPVIAVIFALAAGSSSASAQSDRYGVHTYYLSSYLADKTRELGAGYVRIEIDWDTLQPNGAGEWNDHRECVELAGQ